MPRRTRETYVEEHEPRDPFDLPARRRVLRTRQPLAGPGGLNNPVVLMVAVLLTVFILVLVFGYLL